MHLLKNLFFLFSFLTSLRFLSKHQCAQYKNQSTNQPNRSYPRRKVGLNLQKQNILDLGCWNTKQNKTSSQLYFRLILKTKHQPFLTPSLGAWVMRKSSKTISTAWPSTVCIPGIRLLDLANDKWNLSFKTFSPNKVSHQ